jgi:hypothetical protein
MNKAKFERTDPLDEYIMANPNIQSMPVIDQDLRPFMTDEDLEYLSNCPEFVTLYRACVEEEIEKETFGQSWTDDIEVARFFTKVYHNKRKVKIYLDGDTLHVLSKMRVISTQVPKSKVYGYTNERSESEFIIDPSGLTEDDVIELEIATVEKDVLEEIEKKYPGFHIES